jgi:hypothetical protein
MPNESLDELTRHIAEMKRVEVLEALGQLSTGFPIDFSSDFLAQCSEEQLKHILLAARLHMRRE